MSILDADRQMAGLPAEQQARKAIERVLQRMRLDDRLYYIIGPGSQTFDLLTEAYAALTGTDLAEVRRLVGDQGDAPSRPPCR